MSGDPRFLQALDELRALHLSKGEDYADAADPLRNYQQSADDNGLPAWRAAQLRLSEKYHRLVVLTRGAGRVPNHDSLDDTLIDIAAIALIVRSLRQRVAVTVPVVAATVDETAHRWQHADPGDEVEL